MNHWFLSCLCVLFLPTDSWTRYHRRPVEQENQHKASCLYPDGTIYKEKARQEKVKDDPFGYSVTSPGWEAGLASCQAPAPTRGKNDQPSDQDCRRHGTNVQPSSWQGMIHGKKTLGCKSIPGLPS